jgi:hypothetical protein
MTSDLGHVGYRAGVLAAGASLSYAVVQVLQVVGVLHFPLDEILVYATSLAIVVPFLLEMLAFHHLTEPPRRYWSHAALLLSVIYAVFVTANYVVQLVTVIPAKLSGRLAEVAVLDQTPHSMFWCFDAIGYVAMGLAALFAANACRTSPATHGLRLALWAHAATTPLICVVYFYPVYSTRLLLLGFPWAITAPAFMFMLARAMHHEAREAPSLNRLAGAPARQSH